MRISTIHEYRFPTPEEASFLEGVTFESLAPDQLIESVDAPYTDENWAKFVHSVANRSFRVYFDEDFKSLIKQLSVITGISLETSVTSETPVRCLVFLTTVKSCLYEVKEMKFCKGADLLGGFGVYKIYSKLGFGEELMKMVVTKVVQYSLESCNPFKELMIAIVQPDCSWQYALVQIMISSFFIREGINTVSARIHVFDPGTFARSIIDRINLNDIPHTEYKSIANVAGNLQHFK